MGRLAPGDRLGGDLTLVDRLGEGGVVEAWIARDRARGTVVVKVLGPDAPEDRKALLEREFELARRLEHPAIVRVLGFVREGDYTWLTQERMSGGDARRLRGGPPADVARALLPVVDALLFSHARGVVHRDLKASNVLLDAEGRGRLADFGHGEALEPDGALPALVGGGSRSGQSPQQRAGEAPDPADDVYALGALFYDLLTGQPPFWPDFDLAEVREQAPPPLPPRVPERLAELLRAMLAKTRDARPRLEAVRDALRETWAEGAAPFPRPRHEARLQPPPRADAVVRPVPMPSAPSGLPSASRPAPGVPVSVVAIFGALAVAGVIVLVALPRWVASRSRTGAVESVATSAPEPAGTGSETATPVPPTATGSETAPPTPPTKEPVEPPGARAPLEPERTEPRSSPTPPENQTDGEFTRAMTEGHQALDRGAFAEARAAFSRAEAARPGAPSAAEGLARAEEGLKAEALALHRRRAEAAEAREDWRGALVEYDAALKLDPQVAFAVEGRPRSLRRAEIDERLAAFLKRPDRLATEAVAREAELALEEARDAPASPRLREQVASLERRLREARTPVEVRIESDGLTDVTVLRVGGLGAFRDKSLALRPGSYVVTGKRRGYRDVRKTLVVTHEKSPPALLIRCDEAL
jgi:hypothetical protein